jgi:hypothetical protein
MVLLELSRIKNLPLDLINESSTPLHILDSQEEFAGNFFYFLIWNNNILQQTDFF